MSARSHLLVSIFTSLVVLAASTSALVAQDQTQPQVDNAKQSWGGAINANAVFVRSGPSENYYPTMKLDKGNAVTIVGIKFDWLKIMPPEGSFSYVPKAYVNKHGDGTRGRINEVKQEVPVRAGSSLNDIKTQVQTKLETGNEVEIVGEKDEYWQIKPPAGAYLYVHKQYVTPLKPVESPVAAQSGQNTAPPAEQPSDGTANNAASITETEKPAEDTTPTVAEAPTTQQSDGEAASAAGSSSESTTQPSARSPEDEYDQLEGEFAQISNKPLDEQPVPDLLARYEALAKAGELPSSLLRIVDIRIAALKVRTETREQLVALKKSQEESEKRQMALKAEKQELEERIKAGPSIYTAVGTLQVSSLQIGPGTLYRLTDPATGRTVVYIRTEDANFASHIGKFVGVRGEVGTDARLNLKCITPKFCETVDPSKVNDTVAAQIIPPSLVPQASTAGTP